MPLNKRKFLPWPFNYAKNWYGVELSKTDVEYIDNVITADKMYRMILHLVVVMEPSFYLHLGKS